MDTELPDEQTYAAFTLWEEFGEGSTRGRIAANSLLKSLFPLEDLGNRIDTWIRPQAETMHKILHRFVDNPVGCVTFHGSSSLNIGTFFALGALTRRKPQTKPWLVTPLMSSS